MISNFYKKIVIALFIAITFTQSFFANSPTIDKPAIVIAWSKGGGAHKSMLDALTTYLSDNYNVVPLNPFETMWSTADVIADTSSNLVLSMIKGLEVDTVDGEEAYNHMLAKDLDKAGK